MQTVQERNKSYIELIALYVHPISIKFKQSTQKASYRVKRTLINILCGHVLELIATGIFYEFLNIYKVLRILREQNIVKYQRPKITSDTTGGPNSRCERRV